MKTEMFDNVSREKNCLVWVCIASGSAGNGCKCIQGVRCGVACDSIQYCCAIHAYSYTLCILHLTEINFTFTYTFLWILWNVFQSSMQNRDIQKMLEYITHIGHI